MNRNRTQVLTIASLLIGLLVAASARAASLQKVSTSDWGISGLPSYVNMYIYVPDNLATNPPILVACHSCQGNASGYFGGLSTIASTADKYGFIIIIPEATGRNCWDAGSTKSLTHDGGGDTQAIAQMVKYALSKYNGDASRVYVMGGSSGGMMTQALIGVYPEVFVAGSARAGVPCGCWADGYTDGNQWSNNCAGGRTTKTAQQWGDFVRAINPDYVGHRPRIQLFHGTIDETIDYNNMGEAIKEWTNVLGLSDTPSSTDSINSSGYAYSRKLWKNSCGYTVLEAWAGDNGKHSMPYEQDAILSFFGLDIAGGSDPELSTCSGDAGVGGTGGTSGSGGTSGTGGIGVDGGSSVDGGGSDVVTAGSGGEPGTTGGNSDGGGVQSTGGNSDGGGVQSTGGDSDRGGVQSTGGNSDVGGVRAVGGESRSGSASAAGGASGIGGSTAITDSSSDGCACALGSRSGTTSTTALLVVLGWVLFFRRRPHKSYRVRRRPCEAPERLRMNRRDI